MKRATLKDIASLTGLSISGVSKALNEHPDIGQKTREKVKEVARSLNYYPNPSAQLLRMRSSKIIAVILPEVNTFFFPEVLQGISKVVEQNGYSLLFLQSDNSLLKERGLAEYCLQMFVDGVLISLTSETSDVKHLEILQKNGPIVCMIDRGLQNDQIPLLTIDDHETAFQAVDYLVKKGHTKILGIFDDSRLAMTKLRAEGFQAAHVANQIDLDEGQMVMLDKDTEIEHRITELLDQYPGATAIFTMSDKLMIKACHVLACLGLKIPEDMALIAISDGKAPHYHFPAITHMKHSGEEVGQTAARLLIEKLEGKKAKIEFVKIQAPLIELGSV
ncbi:MAG: LacI family DNA-binding transcriptional regulator [Lewinellaceae bacterium]|nr:LacI family DNA-binding transcriptional regulator [Saprospiraceae bacterium]MCB9340260.1 LacI family DNA-binding transcriptional regulator [Lewinellaceae bacterium]